MKTKITKEPTSQRAVELNRGFTLIEIIIAIAISAVLMTMGLASYSGLRNKKALDTTLSRMVFDLRSASERSRVQQNDSRWGVRFTNGSSDYYEVWSGDNYSSGIKQGRNPLSLVQFLDPAEGNIKDVIFARGTGLPSIVDGAGAPVSGTITITNFIDSKTITINQQGRIDY